jgi:hypothetical protein
LTPWLFSAERISCVALCRRGGCRYPGSLNPSDPGTTSLSIKRINATTLEETDKRDGKIISVSRATLSADGKSTTVDVTDKLRGTTSQYLAEKQ